MKDYWAEPEEKKINVKKIIISVIISILIVALIVFIALYATNEEIRDWIDVNIFRKEISEQNVITIELDEDETNNVYAFNKYICVLNKNQLTMYNSSGQEETTLSVEITNPLFDSSDNYLIIAESEGKEIYLIKNKEIVWSGEIEGTISKVEVNENGYFAVIVEGTSYTSVVEMFDSDGNALFNTYLSSTLAIDVSISKDSKYLALAEIDTSGTMVKSKVKVISIEKASTDPSNSEEETYSCEQGELLVNIEYQSGNRLTCMYTDSISIIEDGAETEVYNNEDAKVIAQSIELSDNFVVVEEESSGFFSENLVANITSVSSKETKKYTTDSIAKEIYTSGDIIALNLGSEVEFINTSGWLVKRYVAEQEVTEIVVSDSIAGIIHRDSIELINF